MSALPDSSYFEILHIRSWERAIAWASLSLRGILNDPYHEFLYGNLDNRDAVTISLEQTIQETGIKADVLLEAKLPYSAYLANRRGGEIVKNLIELSSISILPYEGEIYQVDQGLDPLPALPLFVNSLEKFLAYSAIQFKREMIEQNLPKTEWSRAVITFIESQSSLPVLNFKIKLPIDYSLYLERGSIIYSLIPVLVSSGGNGGGLPFSTILNNNYILNNQSLIGN